MTTHRTFIIIPVYNEDPEVLAGVIADYASFEVVLVDDGSEPPVRELLSGRNLSPRVHFLCLPKNAGQGAAIEAGVKEALSLGGDLFCTVDGDGQHDPESCFAMIREFEKGEYDILLGSRFQNKASETPVLRKLVLKGGILVNGFYSGLWLTDAHCGLRVFGRRFAEGLHFFNPRQAHASEVLWRIRQLGLRWKEFPVKVLYTPYAIKKGQSVWNSFIILRDLLRHRIQSGSGRQAQ